MTFGLFFRSHVRFRTAKPIMNHHGPANGISFGNHFRDGLHPQMEPHCRETSASENCVCICIVTGFHRSWEAASVVISPKKQYEYKPHMIKQCLPSNKCTAACCATLPTRPLLRHLHEPMGSDGDGVDHEPCCVLELRLRHSPSSTTTWLVEDTCNRCLGESR